MKCKDLDELLSAYADGELSRTQKEFIEEHLDGCAACAATLVDFTVAGRLLSSLKAIPQTPDIRETTIREIKGKIHGNPLWRWLRPSLVAGTVLVLLTLLFTIQPWSFITPEAAAASIARNSPEVQAFFDGEQVEDVKVITKVIGNEGDVLVVLVKTETRTAAAEVDLEKKIVTDIVRVYVPELTQMDEQRTIDIAKADARVQELLPGGVIGKVSIGHAVSIKEEIGFDGKIIKTGSVEIIGQVDIESGGKKWLVSVDVDAQRVIGIAWPSTGMLVAEWSELIYSYLNPLLLILAILVLAGLVTNNKLAADSAGVITIIIGILSIYGGFYAWPVGLGNRIITLTVPILGFVIGIMDTRKRTKHRWVPIVGIVLCSLVLAYHLMNFIFLSIAETPVP